MAKKCPPGIICIENVTFLFFFILIVAILIFMYIKSNINFKAAMKRDLDKIIWEDFVLLGYQYHPTIKAKLSN